MTPPEVLVLGGGPSGCAAARLLALWGHRVTLITKPASHGPHLPESIPPSTRKLLALLGVADAIDAAGFVRSSGNTVWWGSDGARVERFADGACGWQVTADRLARVLLAAARDAGVHVEIRRASVEEATACGAVFTLDCTGRSGIMARARGLRVHEPGPRTVALVGRWRPQTPFDLRDPTHTVIESYVDGWAWSVPDAEGDRYVAVMVDPQTSHLAKDLLARAMYGAEINKTERLRQLLIDATLVDGPYGWDASMYAAAHYTEDDLLLVGDAGSFVDPLSSAGVKKALASGWLAAVAVHTGLVRPEMRETALEFFSAREAGVYQAFRSMTARYLADAATVHSHPFWNDRIDHDDRMPKTSSAGTGDDDASVKAAFERIRHADTLSLVRAADLRVEQQPAVSGCEIVFEPRLVSDAYPDGLRYAFDVDLISLIELAPTYQQVPDLFTAYNRQCGPVDLPGFLAALATVVARGWLVWGSEST